MKIFFFTILLAGLTAGLAGAGGGYNQPYGNRSCANSNTKGCQDARKAFAEHHNGLYPDQYFNQWYQGQQGRWTRSGNNWRWQNAEGDQYYQGRQGHWYRENNGWQFRGDDGDEYRNGNNGWAWSGRPQRHDLRRSER
jgi:hypothetical protein